MFNFFKKKEQAEQHTDTQETEQVAKLPEHQSPFELKVKFLSLSEEARIIKRLEKRYARAMTRAKNDKSREKAKEAHVSLRDHRYWIVKAEARSTHLARGFLNGLEYGQIENAAYTPPDWDRIGDLAERYGEGDGRVIAQAFEYWFQKASEWYINHELVHDGKPKPKRIRPSNRKPGAPKEGNSSVAQAATEAAPKLVTLAEEHQQEHLNG